MAKKRKDYVAFDGKIFTFAELEDYLNEHPERREDYEKQEEERKERQDKDVARTKKLYRSFSIKLNREKDKEIIQVLENQENYTQFVIRLVSEAMKRKES